MSIENLTVKCKACGGSGSCPACDGSGTRTKEASVKDRMRAAARGEDAQALQEAVKCSACRGSGKDGACGGAGSRTFLDGLRSKIEKARTEREQLIAARIAKA